MQYVSRTVYRHLRIVYTNIGNSYHFYWTCLPPHPNLQPNITDVKLFQLYIRHTFSLEFQYCHLPCHHQLLYRRTDTCCAMLKSQYVLHLLAWPWTGSGTTLRYDVYSKFPIRKHTDVHCLPLMQIPHNLHKNQKSRSHISTRTVDLTLVCQCLTCNFLGSVLDQLCVPILLNLYLSIAAQVSLSLIRQVFGGHLKRTGLSKHAECAKFNPIRLSNSWLTKAWRGMLCGIAKIPNPDIKEVCFWGVPAT